jgi:acyl-CoA synthetase (NDP forming)
VIVAVPREAAEGCRSRNAVKVTGAVGGAVVYASGYAEVGLRRTRIAQQERLTAEIVRGTYARIVGPNCLGFLNHWTKHRPPPSPASASPRWFIRTPSASSASPARIGFAFNQAVAARRIRRRQMLTAGNSCDIDIADEIAFLAEDPRCKAIACLFEGMSDPERLRQGGTAGLGQRQTQWSCCKVGLTPAGIAGSRCATPPSPAGECRRYDGSAVRARPASSPCPNA